MTFKVKGKMKIGLSRVPVLLVAILLVPCLGNHGDDGNKIPLHFSYITTITGGFRASGGIPAVDLALEEINNHSDVLVNYTLNYTTILDSACDRSASLDAFFQHFDNDSEPTYISTVCCGCSTATIPVAEISHYWNIPQIAYAAAAYELTNRKKYRDFFRVLASFEFIGASLAAVVREFGWRQLAIITQNENLFNGVTVTLRRIFNDEAWTLDDSAMIDTNIEHFPYDLAFSWSRNGDFRIITINTYQEYAYKILCEAFNRGMLPPKYVWITPVWYTTGWWKSVNVTMNEYCPESSILQILNGSLGTVPEGYFAVANESAISFSGLTSSKFLEKYNVKLSETQYESLSVSGVAYDTIWSLALGLDYTAKRVTQKNESGCENLFGDLVPLEEFNYTNQKMGCIMKSGLAELEFKGVTGPIMFNSNGSRPDSILLVQQYRISDYDGSVKREVVADIEIGLNGSKFVFREGESINTLWESGIPYDGYPEQVIHPNSTPLFIIYSIFASAGIVFVVVCLVFNIMFRNKKIVKLASPNLNYLILLGAAILYICAFLYVFSTSTQQSATILCNFQIWLFSLGYTLCFAVILSKTWRIYYIFNNPNLKKKAIKDWILFIIVIVVVAIDIFINFLGTAIPKSQLEAIKIRDREHPTSVSDDDISENNFVFVCTMNDSVIWLGVSFAYKGLLQIVAIFMAFHIRRVQIKALNDSKEIAAIIYINSIILVIMVVSVFVLDTYHDIHAALFGLALLLQASCFLGIIFITKMVRVYLDPQGLLIFSTAQTSTANGRSQLETNTSNNSEAMNKLKKRIQELEGMLDVSDQTEIDPQNSSIVANKKQDDV